LSIDKVDGALCALAAQHLALGTFKAFGEPSSGLIVVPKGALAR
jgi:predicted nuclease with RNAse H fold